MVDEDVFGDPSAAKEDHDIALLDSLGRVFRQCLCWVERSISWHGERNKSQSSQCSSGCEATILRVKAQDRFIIHGLGIDQWVHVSRNRNESRDLVMMEYDRHCAAIEE